jgi:hypothetical protein
VPGGVGKKLVSSDAQKIKAQRGRPNLLQEYPCAWNFSGLGAMQKKVSRRKISKEKVLGEESLSESFPFNMDSGFNLSLKKGSR